MDLSLISRVGCGAGLGEAQALAHTGRVRPSPLEEAMELYQIGRFLELDILAQGCEDLILEWLSLETLPTILQWSRQPHGSAWVHRQVSKTIFLFLWKSISSIQLNVRCLKRNNKYLRGFNMGYFQSKSSYVSNFQ